VKEARVRQGRGIGKEGEGRNSYSREEKERGGGTPLSKYCTPSKTDHECATGRNGEKH